MQVAERKLFDLINYHSQQELALLFIVSCAILTNALGFFRR
jgi:hypothetical protein